MEKLTFYKDPYGEVFIINEATGRIYYISDLAEQETVLEEIIMPFICQKERENRKAL